MESLWVILILSIPVLFVWRIRKGVHKPESKLGIYEHPSNFKKPLIERVEKDLDSK